MEILLTYIWDIVLVGVIVLFVAVSCIRGFFKASRAIVSLVLTAILLTSMQPVVLTFLQSSALGNNIREIVAENVEKSYKKEQLPEDTDTTDTETSLMICNKLALPGFISEGIENSIKQMSEVKNNVMELICDAVTLCVMKILSVVLLFILVRIFVFLILKLMESLFGLPGLKTVNKTLGALVGVFNAVLAVYILCAAISLLAPMETLPKIQSTVDSTLLLKYFYNNNVLLSLFV